MQRDLHVQLVATAVEHVFHQRPAGCVLIDRLGIDRIVELLLQQFDGESTNHLLQHVRGELFRLHIEQRCEQFAHSHGGLNVPQIGLAGSVQQIGGRLTASDARGFV